MRPLFFAVVLASLATALARAIVAGGDVTPPSATKRAPPSAAFSP